MYISIFIYATYPFDFGFTPIGLPTHLISQCTSSSLPLTYLPTYLESTSHSLETLLLSMANLLAQSIIHHHYACSFMAGNKREAHALHQVNHTPLVVE